MATTIVFSDGTSKIDKWKPQVTTEFGDTHKLNPLSDNALQQCMIDAQQRVITKFYERYLTHKLYTDTTYFGNSILVEHVNDIKSEESKDTPWGYLITISFRDLELNSTIQVLDKILTKKWMKVYYACVEREQKYHIHLYCRSFDKPYSQVKREMTSSCKKYTHNLNIKRIKKEDEMKCIDYCQGRSKKSKNAPLYMPFKEPVLNKCPDTESESQPINEKEAS